MSGYYRRGRGGFVPPELLPDQGPDEDANPGESFRGITGPGTTETRTGLSTAGHSSGGGDQQPPDVGAQVGIMRNLEFSAGGRAHRISTGPYRKS